MFQDACHDPVRQFESAPPGSPSHHRCAAAFERNQGGPQFRASGSSRSDGSVVKSNFGCATGSTTRTRSASWRVNHGNIFMF